MGLDILVDQGLELMRVLGPHRHETKVIAKEVHRMVVGHELRVLGEDGALGGILDVRFEGQHALGLGQSKDRVEQRKKLDVGSLFVRRPFQHPSRTLEYAHDYGLGIGDQEGAERGAADDEHLEGLHEDGEIPVRAIPDGYRGEYDDDADDYEHRAEPEENVLTAVRFMMRCAGGVGAPLCPFRA